MHTWSQRTIVRSKYRNMLEFGRHDTQTLKEETRGNVVLNQGNVRIPVATPMADKQNGQRLFEKT